MDLGGTRPLVSVWPNNGTRPPSTPLTAVPYLRILIFRPISFSNFLIKFMDTKLRERFPESKRTNWVIPPFSPLPTSTRPHDHICHLRLVFFSLSSLPCFLLL